MGLTEQDPACECKVPFLGLLKFVSVEDQMLILPQIVKPQLLFHVIRAPRNLHNRLLGALHSAVGLAAGV